MEYFNLIGNIERGVEYLINAYSDHQEWIDESAVGAGHRGILYMQYPAYAKSWPFMALGRILKKWKNNPHLFAEHKDFRAKSDGEL